MAFSLADRRHDSDWFAFSSRACEWYSKFPERFRTIWHEGNKLGDLLNQTMPTQLGRKDSRSRGKVGNLAKLALHCTKYGLSARTIQALVRDVAGQSRVVFPPPIHMRSCWSLCIEQSRRFASWISYLACIVLSTVKKYSHGVSQAAISN